MRHGIKANGWGFKNSLTVEYMELPLRRCPFSPGARFRRRDCTSSMPGSDNRAALKLSPDHELTEEQERLVGRIVDFCRLHAGGRGGVP